DVQVGYAGFLNSCFMLNSIGGGDAQGIQTGAGRAVSDGEVILGEKTQLTCVVGGSHTGAGGIDRTDDGLHVAALGQLHFSAVQGDRGVKVQLGIGGSSLQTQLTEQTAVAVRIGQLDRRTIGGFQSDTAAGNSTSHCAIGSGADGCKNGVYIVSGSNSYSFTIDGEVASHTQHRSTSHRAFASSTTRARISRYIGRGLGQSSQTDCCQVSCNGPVIISQDDSVISSIDRCGIASNAFVVNCLGQGCEVILGGRGDCYSGSTDSDVPVSGGEGAGSFGHTGGGWCRRSTTRGGGGSHYVTDYLGAHVSWVASSNGRAAEGTTQSRGAHIAQTEGNRFVGIGANLEAGVAHGAIQQLLATEGGSFSDTGQFAGQRGEFLLQCGAFLVAVGTVGSLQGQVTH